MRTYHGVHPSPTRLLGHRGHQRGHQLYGLTRRMRTPAVRGLGRKALEDLVWGTAPGIHAGGDERDDPT